MKKTRTDFALDNVIGYLEFALETVKKMRSAGMQIDLINTAEKDVNGAIENLGVLENYVLENPDSK